MGIQTDSFQPEDPHVKPGERFWGRLPPWLRRMLCVIDSADQSSVLNRCGLAIAFAMVGLWWRAELAPLLQSRHTFPLFALANVLAARYCGFYPSLLSLVFGFLGVRYLFVDPRGSFLLVGPSMQYGAAVFFGSSLLMQSVVAYGRSGQNRARQSAARLQAATVELAQQATILRRLIAVQENEKQTLCHEFHDGLIQYAVGALMICESYQARSTAHSAADTRDIEYAAESLRKGIEDGRRAIRGIRPAVLDDVGLSAAIEEILADWTDPSMQVTLTIDPQANRLPPELQTTLYRITQEALANVWKHSHSKTVSIGLFVSDTSVQLKIQDTGDGFEPDNTKTGGFGLLGMKERAKLAGGEVRIVSRRGAGTTVICTAPLEQQT
ncbi:MAG: sensor histidine kinase [Planctomycetota bacterium]